MAPDVRASSSSSATRRLLVMGALLAFSSIFQMGYSNAYPNTAIEAFRGYLNESFSYELDDSGFTWLWSAILNVWFIGFAIGSWIAVPLADRIGRKGCLLTGNALNVVSATLSWAAIPLGYWWLFMGARLLFAVAAAVSMNSLILLLQESSPASLRGTMSFYAEMAFVVMNAVGVLCGMRIVLGERLGWLTAVAIFPTLLSFLIVLPFHESPKFLLLKRGDHDAAARALQFYQSESIDEAQSVLSVVEKEGNEGEEEVRMGDLFTVPHLRKGLLLGVAALQITASIWPIVYLSTELLTRSNIDPYTAEAVSTAMLLASTLSTVFGMVLVERISRRVLFLSCSTVNVSALALFVLSACLQRLHDTLKYGCVVAVFLHGMSYSVAVGPIAWFITAELLPISHRAAGQCLALSINQLIALVLSFATLPAYNFIERYLHLPGALVILPLYVAPGIACILLLAWLLPETRGVEIVDVIRALKDGRKSGRHSRVASVKRKEEMENSEESGV